METPPSRTGERLLEAAAALLDRGGEAAVTIRAVAEVVGVSHNTPYRHYKDRSALLAAVAERDFAMLTQRFSVIGRSPQAPLASLKAALADFVAYGEAYPSRYRLLFSDPQIVAGGSLEPAAKKTFDAFEKLVRAAQNIGSLPSTLPSVTLAGLIFAAAHGLVDLQIGGRLREEKGFSRALAGLDALIDLIPGSRLSL